MRLTPLLVGLLLLLGLVAGAAVGSWFLFPHPIEGVFEQTGPMTEARSDHVAVSLADGTVLIAGGCSGECQRGFEDGAVWPDYLLSAELFDPSEGTFRATGPMLHPAAEGVLLDDGRVLIVAGVAIEGARDRADIYAQVYDPPTGRFSDLAPYPGQEAPVEAIRLADDQVLVLRAHYGKGPMPDLVFDPISGGYEETAGTSPIYLPSDALLLDDGRVLITGVRGGSPAGMAAVYYPERRTFEELTAPFVVDHLAPLPDGRVMALGNRRDRASVQVGPHAAIFEPATNAFTEIDPPAAPVTDAVALADGRVLIWMVGDPSNTGSITDAAQLYDPASGAYAPLPTPSLRIRPSVTPLADGRVLIAGGSGSAQPGTAEVLR